MRYVFYSIAWLAVGLGLLGVFLPVLPTTPFLLVALWAGSKASPKFRWWLLRHRYFGPALRQWSRHGAIDYRAKSLAIAMMFGSWLYLFYKGSHPYLLVFLALLFTGLSLFLLTRPKPTK
ncbi:MAG: YbaN family protein [Granulosicoccaceae bacterium]